MAGEKKWQKLRYLDEQENEYLLDLIISIKGSFFDYLLHFGNT